MSCLTLDGTRRAIIKIKKKLIFSDNISYKT